MVGFAHYYYYYSHWRLSHSIRTEKQPIKKIQINNDNERGYNFRNFLGYQSNVEIAQKSIEVCMCVSVYACMCLSVSKNGRLCVQSLVHIMCGHLLSTCKSFIAKKTLRLKWFHRLVDMSERGMRQWLSPCCHSMIYRFFCFFSFIISLYYRINHYDFRRLRGSTAVQHDQYPKLTVIFFILVVHISLHSVCIKLLHINAFT